MSRWLTWALLLIALGALALRLPQLDRRPLHTDESVHTIKFKGLWDQGAYRYDPNEYHGPSLYYLTWPLVWASGAKSFADTQIVSYRLVPVLFGVGLVLLLFLARDALGTTGTLLAAIFTAVSPAMVFYSRYYIHEIPFVFFTLLTIVAGWRYCQKPGYRWASLLGVGIGMMYATKETFIIVLAALAMAIVAVWVWGTFMDGFSFEWRDHLHLGHILFAMLVAAIVGISLFTSFFTNADGPLDSLKTYLPWFGRAKGNSPHLHPWYYYLDLLAWRRQGRGPIWTEAIVLILAAIGFCAALRRVPIAGSLMGAAPEENPEENAIPREPNPVWFRFIAFFTLFITIAYAAIPYKTPWCLLGFYHGMILLAGMGFAFLWQRHLSRLKRTLVATLIVLGLSQLGVEAYRGNYVYYADITNPYVYAHTGTDLVRLARKVENLARLHPDKDRMLVRVIAKGSEFFPQAGDYWPLPWYFRKMERVGWYNQIPSDPRAPVIIASPQFEPALEAALGTNYQNAGFFGHRPRPAVFLILFVQKDLWDKYLVSPKAIEEDEE
jgi:uncharacterized protein (TIGR03663 family)